MRILAHTVAAKQLLDSKPSSHVDRLLILYLALVLGFRAERVMNVKTPGQPLFEIAIIYIKKREFLLGGIKVQKTSSSSTIRSKRKTHTQIPKHNHLAIFLKYPKYFSTLV